MFRKKDYTVIDRLEQLAEIAPDREALIYGNEVITFKEFNERVNRIANALINLGIKKGEKVAYMLYTHPKCLEVMYGVLKAGGAIVNVNYRYVAGELEYILNNADASFLFYEDDFSNTILEIQPKLPLLRYCINLGENISGNKKFIRFDDLIKDQPANKLNTPWEIRGEDLMTIFYTGGTTGYPKGEWFITIMDYLVARG